MHDVLSDTLMHDVLNFVSIVFFVAGLSIQGNNLQGSLEKLCDARDDRRVQFESYLALMVEADCLGKSPEVICSCCTCF